jgi:hypothetical protein
VRQCAASTWIGHFARVQLEVDPRVRGRMWKWTWKTLCPAALPFSCASRMPGASNAFFDGPRDTLRREDRRGERFGRQVEQVLGGRSFGITSVWPSACGITSMNASVWSSSYTGGAEFRRAGSAQRRVFGS